MITITPSAASKLQELVEQSGAVDVYLRLFVTQGGCEGFSYGMALDTERREDDFVFEQHGIRLVVDPLTLRLMRGSCIEYRHTPMGEGFAVYNPRAVATCGCGHSFKVTEEEGKAEPCGEAEPV
ncbi:MAG: iron-sulfur cluster assembly accessory protein [Armatimonadota bacterium]|nr:iron-sulfur cluster assembly accessory protein [Armatimonadota bacterium]MDR7443402.1 iron-sulfur cluster assembly accessory protein [Armatimonadota bacterium]MDR7567688.1 iron-sulfur cluster assembly accessory protein [Armatimonadota bacterium]